jgi:hypothetical protein
MLRTFIMGRLGTNTRGLLVRLLLLGALAATVAACGGNDRDAGGTTTTALVPTPKDR